MSYTTAFMAALQIDINYSWTDSQTDRGHAPKRLTVGIAETTAAIDAAFTPALSPSASKTQPLFSFHRME
jgi:hypothetical protein